MDYYNVTNNKKGYNICPKADHSIVSEETKAKLSETLLKRAQNPNYTNSNKSSKHSNETKAKQS